MGKYGRTSGAGATLQAQMTSLEVMLRFSAAGWRAHPAKTQAIIFEKCLRAAFGLRSRLQSPPSCTDCPGWKALLLSDRTFLSHPPIVFGTRNTRKHRPWNHRFRRSQYPTFLVSDPKYHTPNDGYYGIVRVAKDWVHGPSGTADSDVSSSWASEDPYMAQ